MTSPASCFQMMEGNIEELESRLAEAGTLGEQVDAMNELAWELRYGQAERAHSLSQRAYGLSSSGEFSQHPYRHGQAVSLTTQAYLNQQQGKLDIALTQCFEAAAIMDSLPLTRSTIDCWRIIGWIYYFLGDISNALNYDLKALEAAQDLSLKIQEASVLDGLAMIYAASGDRMQALQSHQEALLIAQDLHDQALESTVLNNMALGFLELGNLPAALDSGMKSLELARRVSDKEHEVSILDTLGQVLQKMGEYTRGEKVLLEGLATGIETGMSLGQAYCLVSLSKICLARQELAAAESYLQRALDIAVTVGARSMEADCHQSLSEIYERQDNLKEALNHHKSFHTLFKDINSEAAGRRLAALQVAHQVETARRDAEISRLRNEELVSEIEERKKMQAALQELATTDPLSGLFNRRHFFDLAELLLGQAVRYDHPLSVIMLDIDHFKEINDTYGHVYGDQAIKLLAGLVGSTIRSGDVSARYGGDEFVILLPEADLARAANVAERLLKKVASQHISTPQNDFHITLSLGAACLPRSGGVRTIDTLLEQADSALYDAKQAGRNQVKLYQES